MEVLPSPGAVNKTVELVTARWRWRASRRSWTRTKLGYGERFRHFVQDCPGAFRSLTKLARPAEPCGSTTRPKVNNLVHSCHALQHLSLSSCGGLCPKAFLLVLAMDDDDRAASSSAPHADHRVAAPHSGVSVFCIMGGVELVQAPELVTIEYNAGGLVLLDYHPVSIGCAPSLQRLGLYQYQHENNFCEATHGAGHRTCRPSSPWASAGLSSVLHAWPPSVSMVWRHRD